jgi:beta-galactosidase
MIDRGGPILMLQIENEFGSYASNPAYLEELRQLWLRHGIAGPFYTEDGLAQLRQNRTTVAGGAIALSNGDAAQLAAVRREFPDVPALAGEVYPGWLTHWGDAVLQGTTVDLEATLDALMRQRLSFNLYVIHGGTNFGFTAGANTDPATGEYQPDITSYDYAAPISEQGAATPKYLRYRALIGAYLPEPLPAVPAPLPTLARSGRDALQPRLYASLWDNLPAALPAAQTAAPQSFETYGQHAGFVLYRHRLHAHDAALLELRNLHDYAIVHVDGQYAGAVSRARVPGWYAQLTNATYEAPLALTASATADASAGAGITLLDVFVEGMGRVNYGSALADCKGLLGPVVLHEVEAGASRELTGWEVFLLPMTDSYVENLRAVCSDPRRGGLFFRAVFALDACADTYLDMSRWTKGVVWVNGHNLGRYWNIGPQQRLFCPAPWLKCGENVVTIFDLHQTYAQVVELARTLA